MKFQRSLWPNSIKRFLKSCFIQRDFHFSTHRVLILVLMLLMLLLMMLLCISFRSRCLHHCVRAYSILFAMDNHTYIDNEISDHMLNGTYDRVFQAREKQIHTNMLISFLCGVRVYLHDSTIDVMLVWNYFHFIFRGFRLHKQLPKIVGKPAPIALELRGENQRPLDIDKIPQSPCCIIWHHFFCFFFGAVDFLKKKKNNNVNFHIEYCF